MSWFWFWVGVVVVLIVLGAWRSRRARRIHGGRGVRSQGALYTKRGGLSQSGAAQMRAEMETRRGDQQLMGP